MNEYSHSFQSNSSSNQHFEGPLILSTTEDTQSNFRPIIQQSSSYYKPTNNSNRRKATKSIANCTISYRIRCISYSSRSQIIHIPIVTVRFRSVHFSCYSVAIATMFTFPQKAMKIIAVNTIADTFFGERLMVFNNILNLNDNMPNAFSNILLARDKRQLNIIYSFP